MPLMVAPLNVPFDPDAPVHDGVPSIDQFVGTSSLRLYATSERMAMKLLACVPLAVNTTEGALSVVMPSRNGNVPAVLGVDVTTFEIFRKASRGMSTQSDGSEVGCCDG